MTSMVVEQPAPPAPPPRIEVDGVALDALTERQTNTYILDASDVGRGGWVITANLDHLRRARSEPEYRDMLAEADLVVADGMPPIWAAKLQGTPLPERVAGSSMVNTLSQEAGRRGKSLFLLGGDPGTADGAAAVLSERYPGLRIAGTLCPPMGFERDAAEMQAIREALLAAEPDLVYVALGSPKQERLIRDLRPLLPGAWWLGVGISFSFLCGRVQRAPVWLQRVGLEWVHRLVQEPRRLAERYLRHGVPYAAGLLARSAARRRRRARA